MVNSCPHWHSKKGFPSIYQSCSHPRTITISPHLEHSRTTRSGSIFQQRFMRVPPLSLVLKSLQELGPSYQTFLQRTTTHTAEERNSIMSYLLRLTTPRRPMVLASPTPLAAPPYSLNSSKSAIMVPEYLPQSDYFLNFS